MKTFLLSIAMVTCFGFWAGSQTIENFESLQMNIMLGGPEDLSSCIVTENPYPTWVNSSGMITKLLRDKDGVPQCGFYATLATPVNLSVNHYVHVKVWKPRISPVIFKFENGPGGTLEMSSMYPQSLVYQWEELVFDFTSLFGEYTKILFMPDFVNPVGLTDDIIIYIDDFYINNDPTPGSPPVQVMEDYEHIPLNLMPGGPNDESTMTQVVNPDPSEFNPSFYTIKFVRDKDGLPWGGFYSVLPVPIDITLNKYMHVKVWKPRISPVVFKIEGGAAGTLETESKYPQTKINEWEDLVFDLSEKTGSYPTIFFWPDYIDPVGLTEDMVMYFDEIILNNDSTPIGPVTQTINVDMTESLMPPGSQVWISGTMGGIHGIWNEPGTNPNNEMFDPDGDGIYSIDLHQGNGLIAFKFFWGDGWANGDPVPGGDRNLMISGNMNVSYKWGLDGLVGISEIQFYVNMSLQTILGNFNPYSDFIDIVGSFNNWNGDNYHLMEYGGGIYSISVEGFYPGEMIEYKYRINGDWELAEFPNGPNRTHTVLPGTNVITVWYNDQIPPSPGNDVLVDFEDGTWGKLTAHTLGCGTYDYLPLEESFTIIDNPDPSGLNTSSKVCKFRRWGTDYGALSWGGFWANVFPEVDMDINKYVRVKIWKPRITPIRFKLEAGSAGTLEIESMAPQTLINEWEEIIFDFSLLWGSYPIVVFLPDYESPLTITSYIDLYFDDIIVGDLITEMKDPVLSTVNIFPNPVTDNLVISNINDIKWIEIFNTTGQLAKTINTSGEIGQVQINIADLKQGVYILTICSEMSTTSMKLIKKK